MKKLIFLLAAFLLSAAPLTAQLGMPKVDKAALLKQAATSDQDIAHPKRGTKALTWLDRGKLYYRIATDATYGLYKGLEQKKLEELYGKPEQIGQEQVSNQIFDVWVYPNFNAYIFEGKVIFWDTKLIIMPDALEKSYEAYDKAYQLDPEKMAKDVNNGIMWIGNSYKQMADNAYSMSKLSDAAALFEKSYEVQKYPAYNKVDTASIYNAGVLYAIDKNFEKALKCFEETLNLGYYADGEIYYYIFHCYYSMGDKKKAKEVLMEGAEKFPSNERIVEGIAGLYAESDEDPGEILKIIEKAIANAPDNVFLLNSLGNMYDKKGEEDKAYETFQRSVSVDPNNFIAWINMGYLKMKQATELHKEMNSKEYPNQKAYDQAMSGVNELFAEAIVPLEKAVELDPKSADALDMLNTATFRLRDKSPEYLAKWEKYSAMYKAIREGNN